MPKIIDNNCLTKYLSITARPVKKRNLANFKKNLFLFCVYYMILLTFLLSIINIQRPRIIYIDTPNKTTDKIPLTNFKVDVEISSTTAQANYTLTYLNTDNDTLVEAKLKFPFDTDVSVSDVSLTYKNRTLIGQIMKSDNAKIVYNNEKQDKNVAMLVQRVGDYISIDLAGIEPNETFSAKITTFSILNLKFEYKKEYFFTRYAFPTSMVPRYSSVNSKGHEKPFLSSKVNYSFDFQLKTSTGQISSESALNLQSNSSGKVEWNDKSLSYSGEVPDDVVIDIITTAPNSKGTITIENFENTSVTEVLLSNNLFSSFRKSGEERSKSYVFLVDRSGSMFDEPIQKVRSALQLFLHSLPSNSKFEIVGFGSTFEPLFNRSVEYNDETLKTAIEYAKTVSADFGGTEMLKPLTHILPQMPDHLIFLTDGAVEDVDEVKSYCSRFSTRISTIAIGNYASADLLKTISRQSGGTYELVTENSQIEGAVIRSLAAIQSGLSINSIKSNCGVLYQSFPIFLLPETVNPIRFFNANGQINKEKVVIELNIQDISSGNEFSFVIDTSNKSNEIVVNEIEGKKLHCTALLRAINENVIDSSEEFNQSMRLSLMTKQTSFILVDERSQDDRNKYEQISVEIPVKNQMLHFSHTASMKGYSVLTNLRHLPAAETPSANDIGFSWGDYRHLSLKYDDDEVEEKIEKKPVDKCQEISDLQKANGNWNLTEILKVLDIKLSEKDEKELIGNDEKEQLLAGLLAVRYLENNCGDLYKLVIKKGSQFITKEYSKDMIESSKNLIKNYQK